MPLETVLMLTALSISLGQKVHILHLMLGSRHKHIKYLYNMYNFYFKNFINDKFLTYESQIFHNSPLEYLQY